MAMPFLGTSKLLQLNVDRGRALLDWAREGESDTRRRKLEEIRNVARDARMLTLVPLLDAALDGRWPARPFRTASEEARSPALGAVLASAGVAE